MRLEEISKLCGDKLVRVGKDKKEETRPLVTISELQRMKPDEYVLVRHRCPPYKGKLKMDYKSDFGFGIGADLYGKDVVYPERKMGEVKVFDIKEFVKKKKQEKMGSLSNQNPFASPMGGRMPGMPKPPIPGPFGGGMPSDFDLDKMIRDIDAKIAELEKEEEEEKKKIAAKTRNVAPTNKPVVEENVIKPQILDDDAFKRLIESSEKKENEPKPLAMNRPEEKVVSEQVVQDNKPSDIINSNEINFDNFSVKNTENIKPIEQNSVVKEEKTVPEKAKEETNNDDDFFDDFFFEE